jgi:hypothetical protein
MEIALPTGRRVFVPAAEILSLTKLREVSLLMSYLDPQRKERKDP